MAWEGLLQGGNLTTCFGRGLCLVILAPQSSDCPKMCHSTTGLSLKLACWYNHQMDWLFPAELMKLLFVTPFPSAFGKLGLGQR